MRTQAKYPEGSTKGALGRGLQGGRETSPPQNPGISVLSLARDPAAPLPEKSFLELAEVWCSWGGVQGKPRVFQVVWRLRGVGEQGTQKWGGSKMEGTSRWWPVFLQSPQLSVGWLPTSPPADATHMSTRTPQLHCTLCGHSFKGTALQMFLGQCWGLAGVVGLRRAA